MALPLPALALRCDTCNVPVSNLGALKQHMKGKKHCQQTAHQERLKKQAELSIFVRGFKQPTTEEDLKAHFTCYGPVDKVYIGEGRFAFVRFSTVNAVALAIAQASKHHFHGQKLVVKPQRVNKSVTQKPKPGASADCKVRPPQKPAAVVGCKEKLCGEILATLNSASSVSQQMVALQEFLQLSKEEVDQRERIKSTLQHALTNIIQGAELHQFGSSVNGFGTKGSDMDLFLDLDGQRPDQHKVDPHRRQQQVPHQQKHKPVSRFRGSISVKDLPIRSLRCLTIDDGKVTLESLREATVNSQMRLLGSILGRAGGKDFVFIKRARCPVIKFVHGPSNMNCDVSLNNRLALQNTRLLQQLCRVDSRLRPLMMTVRHWASGVVAGNVNSGPRLTNYALSWLVIHFLQQCQPPVLPSIGQLAQLAGPADRTVLDSWDCGFTTDTAGIETLGANQATLEELLRGFFTYYSGINPSTVVLSPREGRAIPISSFQDTMATTPTVAAFKLGDINIQDPFVLDHNIALNVNTKTKVLIMEEFADAAAKCVGPSWSAPVSDGSWGVSFLLLHPCVHKSEPSQVGRHVFCVPFIRGALPQEMLARWGGGAQAHNQWVFQVCALLRRTFEDILRFRCHVVQDNSAERLTGGEGNAKDTGRGDDAASACGGTVLQADGQPGKRPATSNRCTKSLKKSKLNSDQCSEPASLLELDPAMNDGTESPSHSDPDDTMVTLDGSIMEDPEKSDKPKPCEAISASNDGEKRVMLELECLTSHMVWAGRKKARKAVIKQSNVSGSSMDLELEITKELVKAEPVPKDQILGCNVLVSLMGDSTVDGLQVQCRPTLNPKVFTSFFPFFVAFFTKLLQRVFQELSDGTK